MTNLNRGLFLLLVLHLFSCTKEPSTSAPEQKTPTEVVERGRSIYNLNCIACHNVDSSKEGTAGPAIKGSSKELIEARILRAEYPPEYKPKRNTKSMPALPHLNKEIPALTAFLNQ